MTDCSTCGHSFDGLDCPRCRYDDLVMEQARAEREREKSDLAPLGAVSSRRGEPHPAAPAADNTPEAA